MAIFVLKRSVSECKMCVVIYSTSLSEPCLILRRTEQDKIKTVYWYTSYSCLVLIEFEFSRHNFEKFSNIKFHENPFSRSRDVTGGRTDMTKLIVAFRNFAKAPQNDVRFFAADICKLKV
jgi:hypothetical protein